MVKERYKLIMSDTVIKVENLSKSYTIRHQSNERYDALRDVLANGAKSLGSRLLRTANSHQPPATSEEFWALNDVSFEVKQGERVGIIGRNGAGKSTMLKILSRITEPTKGRIRIKGRVASLLEVGTGFHPELTGRENIYLNGAILGMTREEIRRKFDEIVDFAEVEKFLDTAVKRYSSGMYVRLAFGVAAHLDMEIMIVDEVLAVGDVTFQKKCLDKMGEVSRGGRTILFVSHNMPAVRNLCDRGILLNRGTIIQDGKVTEVVPAYLSSTSNLHSSQQIWSKKERPGNEAFKLNSVKLKDMLGKEIQSLDISQDILIEIHYEVVEAGAQVRFTLVLIDSEGNYVFSSLSNQDIEFHEKSLESGQYVSTCQIYGHLLSPGQYSVLIAGYTSHWHDKFMVEQAISFEAADDGILKGDYNRMYVGIVRPKLKWESYFLQHNS